MTSWSCSFLPVLFFSQSIPANRPKQPPQMGTSPSSACSWGLSPLLHLFGLIGWNGWGEKTAQAVIIRISSVLSNLGNQADERE